MDKFRIVARGNKSADLFLYDDIGDGFFGGINAKEVVRQLGALDKIDTLNVRINSGGGSVFEGLAIYNALARYPARVVAHIDSLAASIASIIAMAGAEIVIAENAMMMIHDPYGMAMGTANDMRKTADLLDSVRGSLVSIYAKRTGENEAMVGDMMDKETWFTAAEAVANGFADSIAEPLALAASCDLSRFHNVPAKLKNGPARPQAQMREARLSEMIRKQKAIGMQTP